MLMTDNIRDMSRFEKLSLYLSRQYRENCRPFLTAIIVGMLTYMYCFTNKFETMDDLSCFFGTGSSLNLGRWGLKLSELVFPMCSVPWLNGVISLGFLSIAVCVVIRIFHIQDKLLTILLPALMISFPTQVCTFGYMYTAPQYACAVLLSVVAVRIITNKATYIGFLEACILLTLAIGIYQAYVAEAASLLVVYCIYCLLKKESGREVIHKGLVYIGLLVCSMAVYLLISFAVNTALHVQMGDYATESLSGIGEYLFGIRVAYTAFLGYFTKGYYDLIPSKTSLVFHLLAVATVAWLLIKHYADKENRADGRLPLFLLCGFLLPLSIDCIRVISSLFHNLMLYGFTSLYVLTAVVLENCSGLLTVKTKNAAKDILALCMIVVAAINIYYANCVFMKLNMQFEQAHSFYTSIVTELRQDPEFNEDSIVCIIGSNEIFDDIPVDTSKLAGMREGIIGTYSQAEFVRYYLGLNLNIAGWDITDVLEQREDVMAMPSYPYYGSIRKIDGYYIVRLG